MSDFPCTKDCPRRKPGCGAECPEWQEYLKRREKKYEARAEGGRLGRVKLERRRVI